MDNYGNVEDSSTAGLFEAGLITTNEIAAPVFTTASSLTVDEDTSSSAIAFSATDVNGDTLSYSFSDPAKGSVVNNGDGTYTYTPNANVNGSDSFTITVNDGTVDVTQTVDVTINAVNDAPTGVVSISGTATEGDILTADTSSLADADGLGALSYQWLADEIAIPGAISSTLKLSQAEVGKVISVEVNYTDGGGILETVSASMNGEAENVNDDPIGDVLISGNLQKNALLTADVSTVIDPDGLGALTYQWFSDTADIGRKY